MLNTLMNNSEVIGQTTIDTLESCLFFCQNEASLNRR